MLSRRSSIVHEAERIASRAYYAGAGIVVTPREYSIKAGETARGQVNVSGTTAVKLVASRPLGSDLVVGFYPESGVAFASAMAIMSRTTCPKGVHSVDIIAQDWYGKTVAQDRITVAVNGVIPPPTPPSPLATKVDQWTGKIAEATGVGVAGKIYEVWFWDPAKNDWVAAPPVVKLKENVGLLGYYRNTGTARQRMWANIVVIRPDGKEEPFETGKEIVEPNGTFYGGQVIVASIPGIWKGRIELYAELA